MNGIYWGDIISVVLEFTKVLAWPIVVLIAMLMFRKPVYVILDRIRRVDIPGLGSLDIQAKIQSAKELSEEVEKTPLPIPEEKRKTPSLPLTEANARMLKLGLHPSPSGLNMSYYRELADQDPNLALAGLRIEIEILAKNIAKGFKVDFEKRDSGVRLLQKLRDAGAITTDQMWLTRKIWELCNVALHDRRVTREEANSVIDVAHVLADQYLSWLSWGFTDDWKPSTK